MGELTFEEVLTASAVMYAAARRYCKAYETLEWPDDNTDTNATTGYDLFQAAMRYNEAQTRWHATHGHAGEAE
jgi:hypothetical protein